MDDTFELYDLKVEVVATDRPMVCSHKVGDYFLVQGENLVFPEQTSFSMYSLSALLPPVRSPVRTQTAGRDLKSRGLANGSRATDSARLCRLRNRRQSKCKPAVTVTEFVFPERKIVL